MSDEVQLTVRTNKPVFPVTKQKQLAYILIEAIPTEDMVDLRMPLNFCFVIDHSGSMSGQKLERLKKAVKLAIEQMSPQDIISVVIFDDSVEVMVENQSLGDIAALQRKIDKIQAVGGTKISLGMEQGIKQLWLGTKPGYINRMVLLTDGETHGDEKECLHWAAEAGRKDVSVTALGLGSDWNESLLDDIAQRSQGTSDWIPDGQPEAILETFQREVRFAQSTVVQNARLILSLVSGVIPRTVWRVTPLISRLGHRALSDRDVQVTLGDMNKEQGQRVLIELLIDPRSSGTYRLAQAMVTYDVLALDRTNQKIRSDIAFRFSDDPSQALDSDPDVLNIIEKVTAHKLQTRALDEAAAGNIAGATQKLRAAATRLLEMGEEDLAQTTLDEAQRLERGEGLSKSGTKKIRYETRKLTQKITDW
jgi:Ca-activated chloride channel homolog